MHGFTHGFMPRLTADDIRWVTPPAEPRMSSRAWRSLDRQVARQIADVDGCLSAWAGHEPKTSAIDQLLDERLMLRPPDVMDTTRRKP
jgi:hypothetical protein